DVFGLALMDHFRGRQREPLLLYTHDHPDQEEMPIELFFRKPEDFPEIEQIALAPSDGKVLDIGAGAGSHTLYLQDRGMDVQALELSALACRVMQLRGVERVIESDIFTYREGRFDTLLLLMNGIGLVQTIEGLKAF